MKKAFSLVELLVVIAIIGVWGGVLIASLSGGSETAVAARCLSNMKNLASACQTYGMREGNYPLAGNVVKLYMDESRGNNRVEKRYEEIPGWISAMSQAYICPLHAKKCPKGVKPQWSYLMSAYFNWDASGTPAVYDPRRDYGALQNADKRLLFSEVPFAGHNAWQPEGDGGSTDTDAILQYRGNGGTAEELGVNHTKGRDAFAHVVFADGHVEKLRVPTVNGKPDTSQMDELAEWLSKGKDVSFSGGTYSEMN